MNIFALIIGSISLIVGLSLQFLPKFQPKAKAYNSTIDRRLAVFNDKTRGIVSILLGISLIGMGLDIRNYPMIIFTTLSLIISVVVSLIHLWMMYRTSNNKSINYDI